MYLWMFLISQVGMFLGDGGSCPQQQGLEVTPPGIGGLLLRDRGWGHSAWPGGSWGVKVPGMSRAVCFSQAWLRAAPQGAGTALPRQMGKDMFPLICPNLDYFSK